MSDEKLRLIAQLQDNMSPALRKIKDTLNSIRHTPGMEAATDGMKRLGAETAKFATFGGNASEALGAIGLGGLTAAGSLAGVVVQMRALGDRSLQMKELARETQVSVDWLNAWSHAGLHFGVSADAMQSSLNHLAGEMPGLISKSSKLYFLLSQRFPTFTTKFLSEDAETQIKDILGLLDSNILKRNPQLQKMLANDFFGNGDEVEKLFRDGAKGFWDEFQKEQRSLNPINPELMAQAKAFRDAQIGFNDALENFENRVGPGFLKTMTEIVKRSSAIFGDPDAVKQYDQHFEEQRKWFHDEISGAEKALHLKGADNGPSGTPSQTAPGALQGQDQLNKSLNDSFSKINPLFHKSAYITDGVEDGTKAGVLAAFRELMTSGDASISGGGSGLLQTSFETGGGGISPYSIGRRIGRADGSQRGFGGGDILGPGGSPLAAHLNASKSMTARAQETYDFWRGKGLSRNAALGLVGNEQGEGTLADGKTHLHWDRSHYSGGIVQWDPVRRADILKHTGVDVWHDANHEHQLNAEAWELKNRYPDLWKALQGGQISIGQAAHALVHGYERPADMGGQSQLRGSYGAAWAKRLNDNRKATGLTPPSGAGGARGVDGHIRADIHVHGNAHKATVRASNIEARLHRWPSMEMG